MASSRARIARLGRLEERRQTVKQAREDEELVRRARIGEPGTAVATSSGQEVDFIGIRGGVDVIWVDFDLVSIDAGQIEVMIGDSGGVEVSGYTSSSSQSGGAPTTDTTAFVVAAPSLTTEEVSGHAQLVRIDGNKWVFSGVASSASHAYVFSGRKELSGTLDRVRFGTDGNAFDNGLVNIGF